MSQITLASRSVLSKIECGDRIGSASGDYIVTKVNADTLTLTVARVTWWRIALWWFLSFARRLRAALGPER
jgi:hypothetical protein